jgi:hypothetical protein
MVIDRPKGHTPLSIIGSTFYAAFRLEILHQELLVWFKSSPSASHQSIIDGTFDL